MKKYLQLLVIAVIIFAGCDNTSDKEYMKMASDNMERGNVSDAISDYQKLIAEYPDSELAPEAIVKQAALYHESKVKNTSRTESLNKAADLFMSVSEKYPASDQAASSLFMAGFIFANEIQDYTRAKAVYNLFLKKYPDDDLADDTKEELENMGLTPEQILEKKISAQGNK
jgi:TolA-binding protein